MEKCLEKVLEENPIGILVVGDSGEILYSNVAAKEIYGALPVLPPAIFTLPKPFERVQDTVGDKVVLLSCQQLGTCAQGTPIWGIFLEDITERVHTAKELNQLKNLNREIEAIFEAAYDELYVVDAEGNTLRVNNAACERLYNLKANQLIGKNVKDLEREGVFYPSIASIVIEKKRRLTTIQRTNTGKTLAITANPVFDENGKVIKVVTNSRDITEMNYLRQQLEQTEELNRRYTSELIALRNRLTEFDGMVAYSQEMRYVLEMAEKVANVDSTVLLLGESGVGKDMVAKLIHRLSPRRDGPFIQINCGAIPEALLESEFFGYESGAFTGARREGKMGLFELAHKGTVFLDEIAELPLALQVKLLQVLQDRRISRLGGTGFLEVDVRIIAATNRDLSLMVKEAKFRQDLYYRLNVVPIEIAPLRERPDDIPPLVFHFLEKFNIKYGIKKKVNAEAVDLLLRFSWPGNVRQLANIIERLVVTTDTGEICANDLPVEIKRDCVPREPRVIVTGMMPLNDAICELEQQLIDMALQQLHTAEAAAGLLGVHPTTVMRKMRRAQKQRANQK
ncbi:MAG: sigma-54 interaction domain-containing protein [Bacillota bacterium]